MTRERLLVTGARGFIGSHFCDIASEDYEIKLLEGDIRDRDNVVRNLRDCDTVVHFAALPWVAGSWEAPEEYLSVNAGGTLNLLRNHTTFKRFLFISTSHTYGNQESFPIRLDTVRLPADPYSASKRYAEDLVRLYSSRFGFKSLVIRPYNTFGPRQSRLFVVPTMCIQALTKGKIVLKGDSEREMLFVKDTARAIKGFLDKGLTGVVQICKGESYKISDIGRTILRTLGLPEENLSIAPTDRPYDIRKLQGDPSSLLEALPGFSWTPMEAAIRQTVEWYK